MNAMKKNNKRTPWVKGMVASVLACLAVSSPLQAAQNKGPALKAGGEYMVVANYPNQVHVLDIEKDKLYKTCQLPGGFGPGTLQVSPDRKTVYALVNHYEDIYGVDLDSCQINFHTHFPKGNVRSKGLFSIALSPDGEQLYTIHSSVKMNADHYRVQSPSLKVYNTADGIGAKPVRSIPVPRQITVIAAAKDGKSLYMAGADIYKLDLTSGDYEVAIASRNWQRERYVASDVLNVWPIHSPSNDFSILYTTARFQLGSEDLNTADWIYGYFNINLETGETETTDFGALTEIYFTGMRSPTNANHMYGVLNRLAKYDVKEQKLLKAAELDHSYYCISMNHDGSKVYLSGTFNDVAIFDADSLEPLGKIKLPGGDMAAMTAQVFRR